MNQFDWVHLVYLVLLLLLIAPAIPRRNWHGGTILRNIALWLAVALSLALGYRLFAA